jgi:4-cresol dehydrogenase (hydroxylating) flavoprotein subunit
MRIMKKEFRPAAREFKPKVSAPYGPVHRSVNRTLKKALDPNGILAPGKSGIR